MASLTHDPGQPISAWSACRLCDEAPRARPLGLGGGGSKGQNRLVSRPCTAVFTLIGFLARIYIRRPRKDRPRPALLARCVRPGSHHLVRRDFSGCGRSRSPARW
ncbi:hypothetical protein DB30_01954 [Enhygromyxa salina]|uniref:Uncharacterized protein n=1 Tax=Enhygromyxa salina TaxID=215803 RepID=A0A0C2DEG9_9BACT|nr:hypothetical protein DB30_01954 [Enhygromyxa salina]